MLWSLSKNESASKIPCGNRLTLSTRPISFNLFKSEGECTNILLDKERASDRSLIFLVSSFI